MTAPAHTLIYTHGAGRLGNQIVRFAHWLAWVDAQGGEVEICNVAFWPYARYFEEWGSTPGCVFPARRSRADVGSRFMAAWPDGFRRFMLNRDRLGRAVQTGVRRLVGGRTRALDVLADERLDITTPEFSRWVRDVRFTAVSGWEIDAWSLVSGREETLRRHFRPTPRLSRDVREWLAGLRRGHDVLVGVHMRAGDYRTWNGGRFWFPQARYAEWLRQALEQRVGARPAFVVVSDEPIDEGVFAGLPVYFLPRNNAEGGFADWLALAGCDLVIGPPSTFSATAAFIGGGRIWPVGEATQELAPGQIIEGGLAGAARHPWFSIAVK